MNKAIELLGMYAHDKVTGFAGVLTTISYDLYGCIQYVITPITTKDGKMEDGHWFDASRLVLTKSRDRVMTAPDFTENYVLDYPKGPAEKPKMKR